MHLPSPERVSAKICQVEKIARSGGGRGSGDDGIVAGAQTTQTRPVLRAASEQSFFLTIVPRAAQAFEQLGFIDQEFDKQGGAVLGFENGSREPIKPLRLIRGGGLPVRAQRFLGRSAADASITVFEGIDA